MCAKRRLRKSVFIFTATALAEISLGHVRNARPLIAMRMKKRGRVTCTRVCFSRKTALITVLRSQACQMGSSPAKRPERTGKRSGRRVSRVRVRSLRCISHLEAHRLKVVKLKKLEGRGEYT